MVTHNMRKKIFVQTEKHISLVKRIASSFTSSIMDRIEHHDESKLEPPELEGFSKCGPISRYTDYMSPDYVARLKLLGDTLSHHYAHNSHHPEHYKNGIDGMNIIDIIEMLCDWKAASIDSNYGDFASSIQKGASRFNISPQLLSIFNNSVDIFYVYIVEYTSNNGQIRYYRADSLDKLYEIIDKDLELSSKEKTLLKYGPETSFVIWLCDIQYEEDGSVIKWRVNNALKDALYFTYPHID